MRLGSLVVVQWQLRLALVAAAFLAEYKESGKEREGEENENQKRDQEVDCGAAKSNFVVVVALDQISKSVHFGNRS